MLGRHAAATYETGKTHEAHLHFLLAPEDGPLGTCQTRRRFQSALDRDLNKQKGIMDKHCASKPASFRLSAWSRSPINGSRAAVIHNRGAAETWAPREMEGKTYVMPQSLLLGAFEKLGPAGWHPAAGYAGIQSCPSRPSPEAFDLTLHQHVERHRHVVVLGPVQVPANSQGSTRKEPFWNLALGAQSLCASFEKHTSTSYHATCKYNKHTAGSACFKHTCVRMCACGK